jgi:Leucine-rich repeat (LRR) protein
VSVRVFTLPSTGGQTQELTVTPINLGPLAPESALNIKLDENILAFVPGITRPYKDDNGNLTLEIKIGAPGVRGTAQVFNNSLTLALGTYLLLEPDVQDCEGTVVFADPNLESAVRDELGIDSSAPITCGLEKLKASGEGIDDLSGLEFFPLLTELDLDGNSISDLTPLTELNQLTKLNLDSNAISDLTPLAGLTRLTDLEANNNSVSNLSPLVLLTDLKDLELENNNITDLSPLAPDPGTNAPGLIQLEELKLDGNSIIDISPLTELKKLKELGLENNLFIDISALLGLVLMRDLDLDNNKITDLTPLAGLTQLIELDLDNNPISVVTPPGLTPLAALTELDQLKELSLENTTISNISDLAKLTNNLLRCVISIWKTTPSVTSLSW